MPETEEILKNIWNQLTSDNQTTSDFETWKINFSNSEEIQGNIYNYLKKNNFTESDFDSWSINVGVKKKDESGFIPQDPNGELLTGDTSLAIQPQTEQDYFEGTFGNILRGFDAVTQTGLGDFVDDMARSAATGYYQGQVAEDASDILLRGANATEEDILSYIEANKEAQKLGPSDEMMEYQKTYEENGKGFMGVVMGLYKSGFQVIPEVILSSVISMATNKDSLSTGAAVVGTGALYGAGTGALAGGVGAVPGAIAGAASTLPYAFAAAGSVLEMGATFSELLQEEIEGELTPEKIREAISNEEIYTKIRNKALARGITIGVIDMFTGRIGGRVAGKILSKAGSAATKGTKIKSVLAASGIESVGGSIGEATARGVIGQEMDISEIALEGIAEAPGGIKDVISARFSKPKYKVNGKKVDAATIDNLIETMTLDQLQSTKIKIDNDYEGRGKKLSDRVLQLNIERLILEANPDINPETLSEITRLQLELSSLEGNNTEVAKEKSSILKSKIKDLQENQLETEVDTEVDAFNDLEQDEQIKYIEQAGKELIQESEARGDEEFEITEQQNLERAVELFNKDQQTETDTEVEVTTEAEVDVDDEVVYEMNKTNKKTWSKDFEILDNRKGQEQALFDEEGNKTSDKWWVVNKVTGQIIEVGTKAMAKDVIANAPAYAETFGDGTKVEPDMIITPAPAPKVEVKVEEKVEVEPEAKEEVDGEVIVGRKGEITLKRNNKTKEDIIETPSGARLIKGIDTNGEVYYEVEGNTDELISLGFNPDNFTFNEEKIKKVISDLSKQVDPAPKAEIKAEPEAETTSEVFKDEQVILKEEVFSLTEPDGSKYRITLRTNLDGSFQDGINEVLDANGEVVNTIRFKLDEDSNGISAEESFKKQMGRRDVLEKIQEKSGKEVNSEKIISSLTTDQKKKLGIKTPAPKAEVEANGLVETELEKYEKGLKGLSSIVLKGLENSIISGINKRKKEVKKLGEKTLPNYKGKLTEQDIDNFTVASNILFDLENKLDLVKKALENITQKPRKQVTKVEKKITKVEKQVDNARKALNKLDKDVKIVLHNDDSSYRKATGEETREQSTRGEYNPKTKTIHINATKVQDNTVAHEVFHALLLRNGITNKQAKAITDRMLKAVKKTASPELLQKLKEHSDNYESALQSEESIAELFGILASEYKSLDKPTQNLVQRWINKIAKILGVKKFTDAEVIDLLNVVSAKVEAGQEITEQDVAILDGSVSGVVNGKARKQDSVLTSFTLKRFPTNPNIKLSEDTPLSNFNQKKSNLLESDRMTGAFIADAQNNPVFKFFGGIYFPQITGKWWASRTISKATSIAENMNANRDKDGYIYATPIIMKPNSHMSNQDMFETVWEFMKFDLRSKSSKVTKKLFSEYLTKALTLKSVSLTESDLNIKKSDNIETMITKLNKVLLGDDTTLSFEKRKAIIKAILGDPKVTEDRKFPTAGSISEVASKFEEEKTKQATKLWDIVMLMRTKGTLSTKITPKSDEFYHKSYPAEISSDQEIEVFFLDGAYNIDTTYPELNQSSGKVFSWKEYSEKHPSAAMALSQYGRTAKLSKASGNIVAPQSRKQKVYRAGDLTNKAEPIFRFDTRRSTGHFGTGFYFFSKQKDAQDYAKRTGTKTSSRIVTSLNLDDYNLATGSLELHEELKDINNDYSNLTFLKKSKNNISGYRIEKVANILGINISDSLLEEYSNSVTKKLRNFSNKESASTLIMKALGFEGVNSTGTELDNGTYGTVIYDIKKPQSREQQDAPQSRKQADLAPNGKPSNLTPEQYKLVRTPAFKNWFGDWETDPENASKVVDENGEPLVVYHGTPDGRFLDEDGIFKSQDQIFGMGSRIGVHWFVKDITTAKSYAKDKFAFDYQNSVPKVLPAFLNIKNPFIKNGENSLWRNVQQKGKTRNLISKALESKKDGVIVDNVKDNYNNSNKTKSTDTFTVFNSNQIKLADGSNITFDPEAPSVRKQKPGGKKKPSKKPTQKRTSSIKKAITEIKNVLDITLDEQRKIFTALNDQKKNAKDIKKDIVASLRELTKEGKITPSKMVSVINKVPDDFNNPITVERFVEYMTKVFNDADYGNKMMIANAKKGKARKNASTKIGIAEGLVEQLQRLFSVKPSLIPDSVLDQYMSLINMFGKREAVLSLPSIEEVTQITEDVLQQLDEEHSMAIELADRFDAAEKVMGENGVDYAATIKEMLDNEVITDREYEVMKKYKSEINPPVPATPKTEAEIEAERQETIENIKETKEIDPSVFPSRLERDDAKEFKKLLKTDAVEGLSLDDLKNLFKVIDNINNGYLPHYAKIMISKMTSINDAKVAANAIKKSKLLPLSKIYANLKSKITKKAGTSELVRRNPTFYIDQVFGDFKTQDIFNSIFKRSAEASASYTKDIKEIQAKIEKAEQSVLKSFNRNPNKTQASKYKQMSYLIQQEFLSNPDSNQVNSVEDFLKATIKRINQETTSYTENDAKMLQEILDTYTENGTKTFDNVALYESFNVAERNSIRTLEEINKSLTEAAVYTANIIRGNKITTLKNYTHLSVIPDVAKGDIVETETSMISDMFNKYLKPSTKAKSLIERTGKASPLNFDVYASVQRGSKYTLMDFHLTDPIRTARRTLNQIEKSLSDKDGNMPTDSRRKFNAIRDASVESIENLLSNALTQSTTGDQVIDYIQKQGYRAILAGVPRAAYELTSNVLAGMFMDPKGFVTGIKLRKIIGTPGAKDIMNNLNSTQTNRVFSTGLSGKFVDTGILNQAAGVTASKAKGKVKNTILQLWNNSGQRWIKGVEFTADTLISSPDKLVMQPMWFGSFENRFKQITGTSPNFDKIAANDEAYMDKYSSALKEAKTLADNRSVAIGATDNSFMGILKGTVKPNQGVSSRIFNSFNGFMTRFLIFEYITARTGIMAAMGNGQVSKKQGVALLAGVTTRMVAYTFLGSLVAESIKSLTDDDDEDFDFTQAQYEDDDAEGMKSIDKMLGQAMTSAFTSLLFGRDFGNATKSIINYGLEELNENYGQFLRDGEYDKYRDAIQYTLIPEGRSGKSPQFMDVAKNLFAAYTPMLKTLEFGLNKIFEADKVEPDAIERQQDERFVRLPLEALGVAGFIPFYKDIRKIVLSNMYKGLRKAKKEAANKKKRKEEMLQGYSSETDMKRYDFSLWERTFGPDSPGYDTRQAEKELRRKERKLRQLKKDQMYDYTPPSNNRKRKSSSPFGPLSDGDKSSPFGV